MVSVVVPIKRIMRPRGAQLRMYGAGLDSAFDLLGGYMLDSIVVENTTANAVTGGINIGTTDAGNDIVAAFAVAANQIGVIPSANVLKRYFSRTAVQRLYVTTVTNWNSALLNVTFVVDKINP